MNVSEYVTNKITGCPEYYPYEWFADCELLLKQIENGLVVDHAEKIALKEYLAILEKTPSVARACKLFNAKDLRYFRQRSAELRDAIDKIIQSTREDDSQ